jgi:cbb3-type cytochrome oxidase subunit 3
MVYKMMAVKVVGLIFMQIFFCAVIFWNTFEQGAILFIKFKL